MSDKKTLRQRLEGIRPLPSYVFTFYNIFFWIVCIFGAFLGALMFSFILHWVFEVDFRFMRFLHISEIQDSIEAIPYMWAMAFLGSILLAFFGTTQSKQGYKYPYYRVIFISMLVSMLFGSGLYVQGSAKRMYSSFEHHFSVFSHEKNTKHKIWNRPERGRVAGVVTEMDSTSLKIRSFHNKDWNVIITPKTKIRDMKNIALHDSIKIIGTMQSKHTLEADMIFLWERPVFFSN